MDKVYFMFCLILLGIFCSSCAFAKTYFVEHDKGWHWYDDPKEEEQERTKDPIQQMTVLRTTLQRALDKAILNPTTSSVKNYITLQNKISNQSSKFAKVWQAVLLENPELNYSLLHPTNNLAKLVEHDQHRLTEDAAIRNLAKESGLFFFYSSTCPYCQRFAPILNDFADHYGLSVIPITLDGVFLPLFPNSQIDHGQASHFRVYSTPALFAVNPYTKKIYPIGYGLMSEDELRQRILDVATHFKGEA